MNFVEIALDMEYASYDIYRNIAARASHADMVRAAFNLAEQEKGHARLVAGLLSACLSP